MEQKLLRQLEEYRLTYNSLLCIIQQNYEENKSKPKEDRKYISEFDLVKNYIQNWKKTDRKSLNEFYAQSLNYVAHVAIQGYKNFFTNIKRGVKTAPPYFKRYEEYNSICYPTITDSITNHLWQRSKHLTLPSLGDISIVKHQDLFGEVCKIEVVKDSSEWYACFTTRFDKVIPENRPTTIIGIDRGLTSLVAMSDGSIVENPKYYLLNRDKINGLQRQRARLYEINYYTCDSCGCWSHENRLANKHFKCQKCSNNKSTNWNSKNYQKLQFKINKLLKQTARKNDNKLHHISKDLADNNQVIVMEDLKIKNMQARGKNKNGQKRSGKGIAKGIQQVAWFRFETMCKYKVEAVGGSLEKVTAHYTSQECHVCHQRGLRKDKDFQCQNPSCQENGKTQDADVNAAINIKERYLIGLFKSESTPRKTGRKISGQRTGDGALLPSRDCGLGGNPKGQPGDHQGQTDSESKGDDKAKVFDN